MKRFERLEYSVVHQSANHLASYALLVAFFSLVCAVNVTRADEADEDQDGKLVETKIELRVEVDDEGKVKVDATKNGEKMEGLQKHLKDHLKALGGGPHQEHEVKVIVTDDESDDGVPAKAIVKMLGEDGADNVFKWHRNDGGHQDANVIVLGGEPGEMPAKAILKMVGQGEKDDFVWHSDDGKNVEVKVLVMDDESDKGTKKVFKVLEGGSDPSHFIWRSKDGNTFFGKEGAHFFTTEQLHGRVGKFRLGVALESIGPAMRSQLGLDEDVGLMVSDVFDESPAAKIGLRDYDVLVKIGDDTIRAGGQPALVEAIETAGEAEKTIGLTFIRKGKRMRKKFQPAPTPSMNDEGEHDHDGDSDDGDDDDEDDDEESAARSIEVEVEAGDKRPEREYRVERRSKSRRERSVRSPEVRELRAEIEELREALEEMREALQESDD